MGFGVRKIIGKLIKVNSIKYYYRLKLFIYIKIFGYPHKILSFGGGIGDHLLCTIVIKELNQKGYNIWFVSNYKELFYNNPFVSKVIKVDDASKMKLKIEYIYYIPPPINNKETIPQSHIIKLLCNKAKITGSKIELKPYLRLTKKEIRKGSMSKNRIVISSSGMSATHPMITKEWLFESYQEVINNLKSKYEFIQIGSSSDPLLESTIDMRGKLKLRESASILCNSLLYIGQVGLIMHLARAVNCISVIIYGGREKPWQSGYQCNFNLHNDLVCSPCWSYVCPFDRLCLRNIKPQTVVEAIEKVISKNMKTHEEWLYV